MDRENEIVLQVIKYLVESDALNEGEGGGKGECTGCEQDGEEGGDGDGEGDGDGDGDGDGGDEDEHAQAEAEAEGRVSQTQAQGPTESRQEIPDRIPETNP